MMFFLFIFNIERPMITPVKLRHRQEREAVGRRFEQGDIVVGNYQEAMAEEEGGSGGVMQGGEEMHPPPTPTYAAPSQPPPTAPMPDPGLDEDFNGVVDDDDEPSSPECMHLISLSHVVELVTYAQASSFQDINCWVLFKEVGAEFGITLTRDQFYTLTHVASHINEAIELIKRGHNIRDLIGLGGDVYVTVKSNQLSPVNIRKYVKHPTTGKAVPSEEGQTLTFREWYMFYSLLDIIQLRLTSCENDVRSILFTLLNGVN
jgi:hypothetical protein